MSNTAIAYLVLFGVAVTCVMNVVTAWSLHRISKLMTGGRTRPDQRGRS